MRKEEPDAALQPAGGQRAAVLGADGFTGPGGAGAQDGVARGLGAGEEGGQQPPRPRPAHIADVVVPATATQSRT